MADWQDTQQGRRALDALPTIASELRKIRVILEDAYKEDPLRCTCTDAGEYPPYDPECPVHKGDVEGACTCPSQPFEPEEGEYSVHCPVHGDKAT